MTTSSAPARLRPHLSDLRLFALSPEGRPALLGALGAALIAAGGVGAGSTRVNDPVLESMHLSWLRFGHGLVLSSVLLWAGVALMLLAWLWLGRRVVDRSATEYTMVVTTGFWLLPLLLSAPVFSRDTYSYLAQGALLRDGFDPYAVGPIANVNSLLDNVSPIDQEAASDAEQSGHQANRRAGGDGPRRAPPPVDTVLADVAGGARARGVFEHARTG